MERVTAYIHMKAIAHNFQLMKEDLREGTRMIAVVKTDGYGHGAVPIARMAETYDYIWGFAVAAVPEAKALREAGIRKPILILGYSFKEDYPWMIENGVRPTVFTAEMARELSAARNGREVKVHLAVDTGMSRIGVADDEKGLETALAIADTEGIKIEGVFTHFARADERDKSAAKLQLKRYLAFTDKLEKAGVTGFLKHIANSAGILEFPESDLDLVRAGISIYGIYPSDEMDRPANPLCPAMELKSRVVYLKTVPAGTPVSYGGTYVTGRETVLATIPCGYGDGYPRSLSGKGEVLINGQRAPITGRVCMDQFMVDVSGMKVNLLDPVTLLGKDGGDEISVDELSGLSGRFPYEFVCDIGRRVRREYVD